MWIQLLILIGYVLNTKAELVFKTGFTLHFCNWLETNGFEPQYNLIRADLDGGSYGGKLDDFDSINNDPVIFVHGNSDRAVGGIYGGWKNSIEYFLNNGYKTSELYATTWGPANSLLASQQYHSKIYVMKIRKFIEAVLAYTNASKVDIISHSMGVTLSRKAIKGGLANDMLNGGSYNVGTSLSSKIDTFIGIAGANYGLVSCYTTGSTTPTCGATNGLYPGTNIAGWGRSKYLTDLISSSSYEGSYRYSMWSTVDEIIGYACIVWGKNTCRIPKDTAEKKFNTVPYGHFGLKDRTEQFQLQMVKYHMTDM